MWTHVDWKFYFYNCIHGVQIWCILSISASALNETRIINTLVAAISVSRAENGLSKVSGSPTYLTALSLSGLDFLNHDCHTLIFLRFCRVVLGAWPSQARTIPPRQREAERRVPADSQPLKDARGTHGCLSNTIETGGRQPGNDTWFYQSRTPRRMHIQRKRFRKDGNVCGKKSILVFPKRSYTHSVSTFRTISSHDKFNN